MLPSIRKTFTGGVSTYANAKRPFCGLAYQPILGFTRGQDQKGDQSRMVDVFLSSLLGKYFDTHFLLWPTFLSLECGDPQFAAP